jgi:hypothetical protein
VLAIIGRPWQPGGQLPQMSLMPHVAVVMSRLKRQRSASKTLLMNVPQDRLDELQPLLVWVASRPTPQTQGAAGRPHAPQAGPAKTVGGAYLASRQRLAILWIEAQDPIDAVCRHGH